LGSTLANFFSNKSARANGKKGFYTSRFPKSEGLEEFFYKAAKKFEFLLKKFIIRNVETYIGQFRLQRLIHNIQR
jgi:hypothetical protein